MCQQIREAMEEQNNNNLESNQTKLSKHSVSTYKVLNPKKFISHTPASKPATVTSETIEENTTYSTPAPKPIVETKQTENIIKENNSETDDYILPLTLWETLDITNDDMEGRISPFSVETHDEFIEI